MKKDLEFLKIRNYDLIKSEIRSVKTLNLNIRLKKRALISRLSADYEYVSVPSIFTPKGLV